MIKFRCQRCTQKIAVNTEGIGVVIACPNCAEDLVVPSGSDREFGSVPLELVVETPPQPRLPWVRLIIEKLLPALLSQRREMLRTQDEAAEQIAAFEQRVVLLQMKFQRRLSYYQEQLVSLEAENRELGRQVRARPEAAPTSSGRGRVNLRDAGVLLRT